MHIIDIKKIKPLAQGKMNFQFELPDAPYSFSGKLITLTWSVEFIDDTGKNVAAEEFFLSPTGKEIQL